MPAPLAIVMYHYVRDLENSRYPGIKGLRSQGFEGQLDHILRHFTVVRMEEVVDHVQGVRALPRNALLLTFDDAYLDHYNTVLPLLWRKGVQGSFYPPIRAIRENRVLRVNKVHFLLAATRDLRGLVDRVFQALRALGAEHGLEAPEAYYQRLAQPNRHDPAEVIFIKRLFQKALPAEVAERVLNGLFEQAVGVDEGAFSRELYMGLEHLRLMQGLGMHIGAHGFDHLWLGEADETTQRFEVEQCVAFLDELGVPARLRTMCYPYGSHDPRLLGLLRGSGFALGVTTEARLADLDSEDPLTLPRLDTNDLPTAAGAGPCQWARRMAEM